MSRVINTLYLAGTTEYATSDGQSIRFFRGEVLSIQYAFALRLLYRDPTKDPYSGKDDIIEHRIWVTDAAGQVWTAVTVFSATLFVEYISNFASIAVPFYFELTDDKFQQSFERNLLLEGIRCPDDDRFYRTLLVGKDIFHVQFKYTLMIFDVAIMPDPMAGIKKIPMPELLIRMREKSLNRVDGDMEPLPAIGFLLYPKDLLTRNPMVYDEDAAHWRESSLPVPLIFEPTDEYGEPQENVVVAH